MKWLINDIRNALAALKRGATWLVIGMIAIFGLLAWTIAQFALKTDSALRYLRYTVSSCREMSNEPIIFLFCGMIFFFFAIVISFGELQRFFHFRQRAAHFQARQALVHTISWSLVAIAIAVAGLIFFNSYCR